MADKSHGDLHAMTASVHSSFERLTRPYQGAAGHRKVDVDMVTDAFEMFQYWIGHFGSLHRANDPRSLDHRLRIAPAIARRISEVLEELKSLLDQSRPAGAVPRAFADMYSSIFVPL